MSTASLDPSDPSYPPAIAAVLASPPILRVRGALPRASGVAVVGTRHASAEGLSFTRELAGALAASGLVVWSGGANGIDQAAHEGALAVGGVTVLVAGGGLDRPYPPGSEELHARVAEKGAVVGIVDDDAPPQSWVFHARNAVLAAATTATIVVECPLRSGTRNTTAHARRAGRPVLLFPQSPWSPFAPAVREEIRLGARIVLSIDDLLHHLALGDPPVPTVTPAPRRPRASARHAPPPPVTDEDRRVLDVLARGPRHPDEVAEELGWAAASVQRCLLSLLLQGYVVEGGAGTYVTSSARING